MKRTGPQRTLRSRAKSALLLVVFGMALVGALALIDRDFGLGPRERDKEATLTILDATIGATVEPLDHSTAQALGIPSREKGVVITSVERNGPAAQVGIKVGDVIEKVGETPVVTSIEAAAALQDAPAANVELLLNRHGRYVTVRLPIQSTADRDRLLAEQGGRR